MGFRSPMAFGALLICNDGRGGGRQPRWLRGETAVNIATSAGKPKGAEAA
jgi:hypothetical protein